MHSTFHNNSEKNAESPADSDMAATNCLARLDRVTVRFGENIVFSDLSLCLHRGEHLVLLGDNGSGKSTLLRLLQGELRPSPATATPAQAQAAGSVQAQTPDLPSVPAPASSTPVPDAGEAAPAGRVYWNFEGREEPFALTAFTHVRLMSPGQQRNYVRRGWNVTGEEIVLSGLDNAAMLHGELSEHHYARAAELAGAAGAEKLMGMTAPTMSQGQLRLVLLLRALMSKPALLLLDEPFDGLDAESRERVAACMTLAADRGSTLLISAHREEDIPALISGALLLRNGCLTRIALPPRPEVADPASFSPDPRGVSGFTPAQLQPDLACAKARPDRNHAESRSAPAHADAARASARTVPLVELEQVDVFTDRQHVLFDINWRIHAGEQWILSGANGSGKSTLLRLLYGEEFAAYGGVLRWRGGPRPSLEDLHASVGYVSDRLQYVYDYDISAEDVVISGLRGTVGLYHDPDERERVLARAWLNRMGLSALRDRGFHSLSSGTARRVLLARALAASPPLLLLDEPCSGLDAQSREFFLRSLSVLAEEGVTIVYVSHHEEDKGPVFTHELRLDKGRVAFSGRRV